MKENIIGKIILEARKKKNLSQDALAKKIHVSRQTISNWENDINNPDLETIEKLCKVLDLDFLELKFLITGYKEEKSKRKLNKFLIAFLVILLLVMILMILLVRYKNKLEVYSLAINDNNISITNGIFIKSNVNYYLQLGSINLLDDDINNYKVKLYYKDKDDIRLLIETNYSDSIILNEHYGYGEYFDKGFDINNVYIDLISLTDSKKVLTYKLEFNLLFKSDKLLYFKNKSIGENNLNLEYRLKYQYVGGYIYNNVNDEFIINFDYLIKDKELHCYSESCDGYENYVNLMENEVNNIIGK